MYHYVKQGESLHNIAMYHGITVPHLLSLNPDIINPDLIYPGQRITVGY